MSYDTIYDPYTMLSQTRCTYLRAVQTPTVTQFSVLGWNNKSALGLSIGCYWDYRDSRMHWFDVHTLEATVRHFVETQPLLVSFNGIQFDFPLMRGLLRQEAERIRLGDTSSSIFAQARGEDITVDQASDYAQVLTDCCDTFKALCLSSYDILAEIWRVDPDQKFERGLNSLDAIAQANGLGAKLSHGAQAPRDWQDGQYAKVLNYCQDDVIKTRQLFAQIVDTGVILRGDGSPIRLRNPFGLVEG